MSKYFGAMLTAVLFLGLCGAAGADIQDVLPELEAYAMKVMEQQKVPGMAYAIVENDRIVYANGFGVKELGEAAKVRPSTALRSARRPRLSQLLSLPCWTMKRPYRGKTR